MRISIHAQFGGSVFETPWKYSQLEAFYLHIKEPMQIIPYLREYLRHPALEYLVKLRLYRLAQAAVYGEDSGMCWGKIR